MKANKDNALYTVTSVIPIILLTCMLIAVFIALLFIDLLVAVIFAMAVVIVTSVLLTRKARKRLKAERGIKRLCKSERYQLTRGRGFLSSFRWSAETPDLILKTGRYVYYVHYLTPRRYRSSLTFEDKEGILYTEEPLKNNFTVAMGARAYKRIYETRFSPLPEESYGKRAVRVILVNPVCGEMFERGRDGGLASTGNGLEIFGYTVMTGSGFIEAIRRNEKTHNDKNDKIKF